jgi:hypothetical protein
MVRSFATGLLLAALAASAGCQGEPPFRLAAVEGSVTRGGKPLAGVIVVFWGDPEAGTVGPCSLGPTDAAGRYELHTEQGAKGAVVGRHKVCILDSRVVQSRLLRGNHKLDPNHLPDGFASPGAPPVALRYADQKSTPLRAEVGPAEQVIDLEVK